MAVKGIIKEYKSTHFYAMISDDDDKDYWLLHDESGDFDGVEVKKSNIRDLIKLLMVLESHMNHA